MAIALDGSNYLAGPVIGMGGWTDLSLGAWVYTDLSGADEHSVWNNGAGSTYAHAIIRIEPANGNVECFLGFDGDETQLVLNDNPVQANTWTHIVLTYDGVMRGYVNGVMETTTVDKSGEALDPDDTTRPMQLGRDERDRDYLTGMIADAFLFDRALSQTEISAIYNLGRVPWWLVGDPNCLLYWPLIGPSGAVVNATDWGCRDLSGNGNHVSSVNSAPTWADDPLAPQAWTEGLFGGAWAVAAANVIPAMDYYYRRRRTA